MTADEVTVYEKVDAVCVCLLKERTSGMSLLSYDKIIRLCCAHSLQQRTAVKVLNNSCYQLPS